MKQREGGGATAAWHASRHQGAQVPAGPTVCDSASVGGREAQLQGVSDGASVPGPATSCAASPTHPSTPPAPCPRHPRQDPLELSHHFAVLSADGGELLHFEGYGEHLGQGVCAGWVSVWWDVCSMLRRACTDGQAGRQAGRQATRQAGRQAAPQAGRQTTRQAAAGGRQRRCQRRTHHEHAGGCGAEGRHIGRQRRLEGQGGGFGVVAGGRWWWWWVVGRGGGGWWWWCVCVCGGGGGAGRPQPRSGVVWVRVQHNSNGSSQQSSQRNVATAQ